MIKKIIQFIAAILLTLVSLPYALAANESSSSMQGKKIVFDRKKGNCLACHVIDDGKFPGTLGPPLIAMQARYPDKTKLRMQIWDASKRNLATSMPPFGKHRILTEDEIDKIVDYIYSL